VQEDEEEALHRERAVVRQPMVGLQSERPAPRQPVAGTSADPLSKQEGGYPTFLPRHSSVTNTAPQSPGTSPSFRPMAASMDRDAESVPPSPAALDLDGLRRGLIRDIMCQLRNEFERGG
jgi:hypothetical protein